MPEPPDIQLAARRLVELESIRPKLFDSKTNVLHELERCLATYRQPSWGRRELRTDLNGCEWSVYQHTSLLHMLGELCERTRAEFDVQPANYSPIRYEAAELVGIRHAIHHNGLIGLNIADVQTYPEPLTVMPLESIRIHGSWGGNHPKFQTFFHDVSGDAIVLSPLIEDSYETAEGLIEAYTDELQREFGEDELSKEAASIQIYGQSD